MRHILYGVCSAVPTLRSASASGFASISCTARSNQRRFAHGTRGPEVHDQLGHVVLVSASQLSAW